MDQEQYGQLQYNYEEDNFEDQIQQQYQYQQQPHQLTRLGSYSQIPKMVYTYSGISNTSSNNEYLMQSRISEQNNQKIKFFRHQQLYSSIQNTIDDLKTQLMLDDDLIMYLLYRYKWSCQKLYQSYYDQAQQYQQKNNKIENFKKEQKIQIQGICDICYTQQKLLRNPLCIHSYCINCWEKYIQNSLQQGQIFFSCMQKCQKSPILLYNFISVYIPELISLYRKKICINYCQFSNVITYCPNIKQNCDLFAEKLETMHQNNVQCICGTIYCFKCRKQPHYPATCADVSRWQLLLNKQEDNVNWIKRNTKKCPKCKNAVEKSIGCSYIKCVCGTQFCYKCNQIWDQYHKDNKGECLKLIRKQSLKQKGTSQLFLILQQKIQEIERVHKKNKQYINNILVNFSKQDKIYERISQLKGEIEQAQRMRKWALIEYKESIVDLMQPIKKISKMNPILQRKQLLMMSDQLVNKKQKMHKSQIVWMQAWRSL